MNPANESPSDPFTAWLARANDLFDTVEALPAQVRVLGSPPPSDDASGRVDGLAALWLRCQFLPVGTGDGQPWDSRVSVLSDTLRRTPEDLLRQIYAFVGEALRVALTEVGGTDPQRRLVATENLNYFTFRVRGERDVILNAFKTESLGETVREPVEFHWAACPLDRLPTNHPLSAIADGWRSASGQGCAILGPAIAGKPAAFIAVSDAIRWTQEHRAPQRFANMESERRRKADEAARLRGVEQSELGRLTRIEKELAAMRTGK